MINKQTYISVFVMAGCAAALASTQPGAFSEGSTMGSAGWKFSYSAVAKPPLSPGQHIKIQSDAIFTEQAGGPTVFHRFFSDPVNRTFFGYDLVVEPVGQTNSATVKFQPLSLRGDQLPRKYASSEFHAATPPRFPSQTFKSGQKIAVDVLENPTNRQKVVDYIHVSYVAADTIRKPGSQEGVAVAARNPARPAPAFAILRGDGPPIQLSQYRGKIIALAFIHTTCPHCQALTTALNPIARDYAPKGVQFLECAFNTAADQAVPQFIQQYQPSFPVGWSNDSAVRSFLQFSAMDSKMFYVPHMVFIDRMGMIQADYPGESPFFQNADSNIRAELDKMLKASAGASAARKK